MKRRFGSFVFLFILFTACSSGKTKYQLRYNDIWKEIIQSQVWKESLNNEKEGVYNTMYASADDAIVLEPENSFVNNGVVFEKQYHSLVSRAYFKIITEAEKLDARITAEYNMLKEISVDDTSSKNYKEEVVRKYKAHKAMLSGLKSWNIFSENRSGDLAYFKKENREAIQKMYGNGESKDQMVNFLIYKLADLYHVEK
ncbi:hypothetical protein [Maribacter thermophilus]|uniref:hypothetical protein n=1 Tax=Maribacter thermophilus TaxID=1197874 RepID=UPI000641478D|nr:hypothetical protein [Maribacter thermophilus]